MTERVVQVRPAAHKSSADAAGHGSAHGAARAILTGPHAIAQRRLAERLNASPRARQMRGLGEMMNASPRAIQMRTLGAKMNARNRSVAQLRDGGAEAASDSMEARDSGGLPQRLQSGVEALSGLSMDAVAVHRNSREPAQLGALAYARGTDIHLGPGQEKHLPHEAWHVVQQAQGRVRPTRQMKAGVPINDDRALELEADLMGARAVRHGAAQAVMQPARTPVFAHPLAWLTQLVDYPADSTGTIDTKMTEIESDGHTEDVSGAELQKYILDAAGQSTQALAGYRLGSFYLTEAGVLHRKTDTSDDEAHGMPYILLSEMPSNFDDVIKILIEGTLSEANQWQYIMNPANKDQIFPTHHVIIDVDCQFNRAGAVGFHKDSRGTTAFVNLTFENENPMTGTDHYEDLEGDQGLEQSLPDVVKTDIKERRDTQKAASEGDDDAAKQEATDIRGPRLPAYGRISFSDPNLYHSTPRMGHRLRPTGTESEAEMRDYLNSNHPKHKSIWDTATEAVLRANYLEVYNMHSFEAKATSASTGSAKQSATEKRQRRLSVSLNKGDISQDALDTEAALPRTFVRTWVRFVLK